jgi:YD repeat-containing protein
VRLTYDARGNVIRQTFHGVNGEPVLSKENSYHGWEAEYDARGNVIRQTFHGVNGEPVLSKKNSYHGWEAEYDEQGNQTVVTYLSLDGKPTPSTDGYARVRLTYDARGNVIRQTFHDVNGEPVLSKKNSYHGWQAEYDDNGNRTVETYIGLDGKTTPSTDGYATMKSTYDARGNVIRQTFHDVNGEPVQHKRWLLRLAGRLRRAMRQ